MSFLFFRKVVPRDDARVYKDAYKIESITMPEGLTSEVGGPPALRDQKDRTKTVV